MSGPRRIVIYRLGSLGDTVVALPCLHAVAKAYPEAERVMLTNIPVSTKAAPLEAILGGSGLVHRFVAYPVGTRSLAGLLALRRTLRALDARTLVYLTPPRGLATAWRDWLFFRLCGFTHVVGTPLSGDLQRNRVDLEGVVEWECQRLARCIAPLGEVALDDRASWDLHLTDDERAAGATALGAVAQRLFIAINMGGKEASNDWGEANWLTLITRLAAAHADHALVVVGAPEDSVRAARVGAAWPEPVVNLCGRVSPRVSAAAMAGARVFVGHDSGPLHLAAAVGVRCVGLFGPKNRPRQWHPYGAGHRVIHEMRGVLAIGVDQVEAAVHAQLAGELAGDAAAGAAAGSPPDPAPLATP